MIRSELDARAVTVTNEKLIGKRSIATDTTMLTRLACLDLIATMLSRCLSPLVKCFAESFSSEDTNSRLSRRLRGTHTIQRPGALRTVTTFTVIKDSRAKHIGVWYAGWQTLRLQALQAIVLQGVTQSVARMVDRNATLSGVQPAEHAVSTSVQLADAEPS